MIETVNQAFRELLRCGISADSLSTVWRAICEDDNDTITIGIYCHLFVNRGGTMQAWHEIVRVLRKNKPQDEKDVKWLSEGF